MDPRLQRFDVELSHLRFVESYLRRAGLYVAASEMQERRREHQERWARAIFKRTTTP